MKLIPKVAGIAVLAVAGSVIAFVPANADAAQTVTVHQGDLIKQLSDTRTAGKVAFLKDGLHVTTTGSTSQAKAAEYFAVTGSLPTSASIDWTGTQPQAGAQIVFDADDINDNGNDYNVLVVEPVYNGDAWLTTGSSITAKDADPSGPANSGSGSDFFGTLADWKAALPKARVYAGGFSLGSGVEGDGIVHSITIGETEYDFTNQGKSTVTVRQGDLIKQLSDTRTAGKVTFLKDGLRVTTTDSTSQAKAAEYFPVDGSLPTSASIDWTGTQPQASTQIVFDADGITGNGNDYNILVGEPVYGANFWLTNSSSAIAKAADPSGANNGGNGSAYFGTLAQWKAALPDDARVYADGSSLGSGVKGDGVIESITLGDTEYDFTSDAAPIAANEAPTARFAVSTANLAAEFDGSYSADHDGTITGYAWNFGDNAAGSGVKPAHVYTTAGTYQVTLTVTDDKGAASSTTKSVTVAAPSTPQAKVVKDVVGRSVAKKTRHHKVRVDMISAALPADATEGKRLGWKIKVDGRTAFGTMQHADDRDRWTGSFAKNTGRHTVKIFKNGDLVRTIKVNTKA